MVRRGIGPHILVACVVAALPALGGCASGPVREAFSKDAAVAATFPGYENIRYWGDEAPPNMEERAKTIRAAWDANGSKTRSLSILAISGGAEDGAYGAGLLNGWSEKGDRPQFDMVTGISTGALAAPFAFMGPAYDRQLMEVYTKTDASQVFKKRVVAGLLGGESLADTGPLLKTIQRYANADLLAAIGEEHRKGRRLLIGTTNIDLGRPVIWDIGAIANSGLPNRVELFQKILLASAAIPGMFPPVKFETVADGRKVTELHVDGGVVNQVFAYPPELGLSRFIHGRKVNLYVIRNSKEKPDFQITKASALALGSRSTSVLIRTQGVGDLYRIYATSKRDGLNFQLVLIPAEFSHKLEQPFDTAYMGALYRFGLDRGRTGIPWQSTPPGMGRS
ncbi:alpha/beta hydrolase [Terrihabitans soli]|uniref:Alpha/beta hydrolase n=1 Tax=Terrihabitans soli TaxID=708113 RepID=A0A6S6QWT0_9HYPH|nr:patatin-like phospholipase family protein [Terrihabitans soli]BCJ90988.1 alpha/beta hydrolase [Terrihabitans soli]